MFTWDLPGFDTLEFKPMECPSIEEIFKSGIHPAILRADADTAYKHGGELVRYFIDNAPLKNDKKQVIFRFEMKYIMPGWLPVTVSDWHIDGCQSPTIWDSGDRTHIYLGPSTELLTQYLEEPVTIQTDVDIMKMKFYERMKYMEERADEWGFKAKSIKTGEWCTMSCRHFHKVTTPRKPEYRVFIELLETTHGSCNDWELGAAYRNKSVVYTGNHTLETVPSIVRTSETECEVNKYWLDPSPKTTKINSTPGEK